MTLVADLTGPLAFYGGQLKAGVEAGLDRVNTSGVLGTSKIKLDIKDTGSDTATASRLVSAAVQSNAVAILGPSLSQEALATAPIAQQAKVPYLADTAPPGLVEIGEYVYSMTTPQSSQVDKMVQEVKKANDSVAIINSNDSPTIAALAEQTSKAFTAAGVRVTEVIGTSQTATDFTAVGTRAIQSGAKAIGILGGGPMMPSVLTTLRTQGFTGEIFGNAGSDGTIDKAGAAANGYRYTTEWAADLPGDINADFVKRLATVSPGLTAHYPAVDGYTEMLFLAESLKAAGSADRTALLGGMQKVAAAGFDGPSGRVTFGGAGGRQLIGPAIYVEFRDGKATQVTG
ncbi:MAG: hypothetical protein ABS81_02885 [Pseudonocardia sp. SCN 72-86]|nr:MAG: hypothetical protein ABS81_02885 [Pseudonocardia sp. SCN 72-86]